MKLLLFSRTVFGVVWILASLGYAAAAQADAFEREAAIEDSIVESTHSVDLEFTDPDDLAAQGWSEVEADVWRTVGPDGSAQEVAFGQAARKRILADVASEMAKILAAEEPSEKQLDRLAELEEVRDKLQSEAMESLEKGLVFKPACAGSAQFNSMYYTTYDGSGYLTYNAVGTARYTASLYYPGEFFAGAQSSICYFGCEGPDPVMDGPVDYPGSPYAVSHPASRKTGSTTLCYGKTSGWISIPPPPQGFVCDYNVHSSSYLACASF